MEECESPDGTVKRIHNGNITLASFSVLMLAYTAVVYTGHMQNVYVMWDIVGKAILCCLFIYIDTQMQYIDILLVGGKKPNVYKQ